MQRERPSRKGVKHQAPVWGVFIAVLLIVVAAAFFVDRLNGHAEDRIRAQAYLFAIEEDAAEEHIAADEALRQEKVAPEVDREVAENRRELAESLDELERLDPKDERLARVREALGTYEATIDEQLRLIESGQLERAKAVERERVDSSFGALHEVVEDTGASYEDAARRAALIAGAATYAIIFLAATMAIAIVVFRQREQARRSEQEAVRRSEERFPSLVQNASDVILVMGTDQTVRYVSPSVERVLGYEPKDVVGKDNFAPVHPEDLPRVRGAIADAVSNPGIASYMELRLRHADGSWRHIESTCTSLLDDPAVGGIVINSRDVTERKRAEEKLQDSEERFRSLVEQAADALFVHDLEGKLVDVNQQACESLGYTREELLTLSVADVEKNFAPEALASLWERIVSDGPVTVDGLHRRKDGATFPVEVRVGPLTAGGRRLMLAVARDVTERRRAESKLREAEEKYRTLIEQIPVATYIQEIEHNNATVYISPQIEDILGYSSREYTEDPRLWLNVLHPDDRERVLAENERTDKTGEPFRMEYRMIRRDGSVVWVQDEAVVVRDAGGRPHFWQGVMLDVTERKRAEEEVRRSEARNRAILEATPDLMFRVNRDGECLDFQANDDSKLWVPREEIVEKNVREVMPPDLVAPMLRRIAKTLDTGEMQVFEYRLFVVDGVRDFEARLVVSGPGEVLSIVRDVTERKALQRRLEHQAFHDALTGLPNRALFVDRLEHALARIGSHRESMAVLFLDLDNFKVVNDSLGHETGDRLLVAVAERLRACLRPQDTLARLGGDEFTLLLEDVAGIGDATAVAERIAEALLAPFALEGQEVYLTASIGIALGSSSQEQPGGLLRSADLAMYRAKETGKARHQVFDPGMEGSALERLKLEGELRRALEQGEFRVHYQPQVLLETGKVVGFEALVRWEHPERGQIPPTRFVPVAEETGLIVPIGRWVLEEAVHQAKEWQERYPGAPPLVVSVNLSAAQLRHPDLVEDVARVLEETGLEAGTLALEITESVLLEDIGPNIATLERLKDLGVRLGIDDFGTGYSSLSYLKRLPVNFLKIDKSFVKGLEQDRGNFAIVLATLTLAHALDLRVVAEGVETTGDYAKLRELACDVGQGYYFSGPLANEAAAFLLTEPNKVILTTEASNSLE